MTAVVRAAAMTLAHAPELVRYGSKPARLLEDDASGETAQRLAGAARSYGQAVAYLPGRVFIGAERPEALWDAPRPAWAQPVDGHGPRGPYGEVLPQAELLGLLAAVDRFSLVRLEEGFAERSAAALARHPLLAPHAERAHAAGGGEVEAALAGGALPLCDGGAVVGSMRPDHDRDEALAASVLLENLACKATGVLALRHALARAGVEPGEVEYALGCGEEAIGDRYQRGGGGLAKAVLEEVGCERASGSDVKAFCCGPLHALVLGSALIEAGVYETVVVVAGGSLAKLGMKASQALEKGVPILEDVLAGMAVVLGRGDRHAGARVRLDCVGRFAVGAGSSQQAIYENLCVQPLERVGSGLLEVDRYAVELHDPEITEPAGGGDVARRNYRFLGGLAVRRGELDRAELDGFERRHGMPGFSPTQGHIASAVPWLPHALDRIAAGELENTMLVAKGSLFLGRMTQLWDGMSVLLDHEGG